MEFRAERYLSGLQSAAKRRKQSLTYSKATTGSAVKFKWHGAGKGVGKIHYEPATQRVFILERSGDAGDSVVAESNRIFDSFQAHSETVPWSVLEFEVRLPQDFNLEKFKFLTGRVTLNFKAKGIDLTAERWGLADMILAKHPLAEWGAALLGGEIISDEGGRLHLAKQAMLPTARSLDALVRHDPEANRLVLLKAMHRGRPPQWDWLP